MFTLYYVLPNGQCVGKRSATFDRLPERTTGDYWILAVDGKGHWLWIGADGDTLRAPRLESRLCLGAFAN